MAAGAAAACHGPWARGSESDRDSRDLSESQANLTMIINLMILLVVSSTVRRTARRRGRLGG